MNTTRLLHCHDCDVAYRGVHHIDHCWACGTSTAVTLADGIRDQTRLGATWRAALNPKEAA